MRLTEDWFKQAVAAKSVVVGRRNDKVVGYLVGTSLAAKAHVPIIQAMMRAFPPWVISRHRPVSRLRSLCSLEQTSFASSAWVEMGQKQTYHYLFDHPIGAGEQARRDS